MTVSSIGGAGNNVVNLVRQRSHEIKSTNVAAQTAFSAETQTARIANQNNLNATQPINCEANGQSPGFVSNGFLNIDFSALTGSLPPANVSEAELAQVRTARQQAENVDASSSGFADLDAMLNDLVSGISSRITSITNEFPSNVEPEASPSIAQQERNVGNGAPQEVMDPASVSRTDRGTSVRLEPIGGPAVDPFPVAAIGAKAPADVPASNGSAPAAGNSALDFLEAAYNILATSLTQETEA